MYPLIKNLDDSPFINEYCYLEPQNYYRELNIIKGRGGSFHCAFCHEGAHTKAGRFRSVENVGTEIDVYLNNWRGDEPYILFTDDTFTLNFERLRKICEGLMERRKKYNFTFFCKEHFHTLYKNTEMIPYLEKASC